MISWFSKLKKNVEKTTSPLVDKIDAVLFKKKLDAETLTDLEDLLIAADTGATTAADLVDALKNERFDKETTAEDVRRFFAQKIEKFTTPYASPFEIDTEKKPFVVLMVGVNGAGKTTTIGKLAHQLTAKGLKVRLAAADTFRAAAVEQLKVWGERTRCPVVARETGADAAGLVFDAVTESLAARDDVLFIDTAGRLQNRSELMAELEKITRILKKKIPDAPHASLLVMDATVGQNAHAQAKAFSDTVGVDGFVLTKLDGTAKGGVMISLTQEFKKPVYFVGLGEKIDDLQPFSPRQYAYSLMGLEPEVK